ncbi:MAG: hypothetical protein OXI72_17315 [Gemmatimonadota bacterium]|nr:hypothetical protein [Gemmatimonadota bacterium]
MDESVARLLRQWRAGERCEMTAVACAPELGYLVKGVKKKYGIELD